MTARREGMSYALPSSSPLPSFQTLQGFYKLLGDLYDCSVSSTPLSDRSLIMSMLEALTNIRNCEELVLLDSSQTQPRDARKTIAIDSIDMQELCGVGGIVPPNPVRDRGLAEAESRGWAVGGDRGLDGIDLDIDCIGLRRASRAPLSIKDSRIYGLDVYEQANDLVTRALVDSKLLVTHRHHFKRAIHALETTWVTLSDGPSFQEATGEDGGDSRPSSIDTTKIEGRSFANDTHGTTVKALKEQQGWDLYYQKGLNEWCTLLYHIFDLHPSVLS
ncbi:hypothetical protein BT69DRAFT_1298189 [Atractiella rhizophila]|nr:hypothetical protein BT69DRAFT_1298189 [Atractiella rhizophila]